MGKERITLDMSVQQAAVALGGGNPGALQACFSIFQCCQQVDPDWLGGFGPLLMMDSLGIHDHKIWLLFKEVCHEKPANVIAVLRAYQLGQLAGVTNEALNHAMDNRGEGIDLDAVKAAVKARIPSFKLDAKA